mgnify:CR=1 FL=1
MLEILKAIFYGIVEGITEWLPISSTGHLIIFESLIPMGMSDEFMEMFRVVIQFGAILAVVVLFWKDLWPFEAKTFKPIHQKFILWFKIIFATIPAVIIGLLFEDLIDKYFYNYWVVALALIIFGIAFIYIEKRNEGVEPRITELRRLKYKDALIIGLFQVLAAIFPGTSRSGATILGGIAIGTSRKVAAEFTFFLAIPVMFGASLLKLLKFGFAFTALEIGVLLIGSLVAFGVSLVAIRFLMSYIKKHDFKVFGWYRIALGVLVLLYHLVLK